MELKAVRIQNFLSVENAVVDFSGEGTTLVVGGTGSGKSALFVEPLLWQWYDMLNRPANKSQMDGVKRRYRMQPVAEPTSVETWFNHAGHDYYVKRTLEDGWEISRDGAAVTPYKTKGDGVQAMQQAVGLPPHLFRAIAVMGQGFQERFTGFKDSDRTTIIEDFLGAAAYEQGQAEAKAKRTAVEHALRTLSATRQAAEQAVSMTEGQISTAEQERQQLAANIAQTRQALEGESAQLGIERGQTVLAQTEAAEQKAKTDALIGQWEDAERQAARDVEAGVVAATRLETNQTELTARRQALAGLQSTAQCPTCFQPVDVALVETEAEKRVRAINQVQSELVTANESLTATRHRLQESQTNLKSLRDTSSQQQQVVNQHGNRIREIDARFDAIQRDLTRVGEAEIVADRGIRQLQERLASEQANLEAAMTAEAEYKARQPYLSWWDEGFSIRGIRSKRLGGVLETMNENLADYCGKLFDNQIMVRLLPVKPQKTASAKSVVSVQVSAPAGCYEMASGGQERCIDLAIHFALRRFAKGAAFGWASNFLVGDEVFDHLDRPLAERALGVLKGEAQRVFLITHSPALQALCDSTWHVRYEDERTQLGLMSAAGDS